MAQLRVNAAAFSYCADKPLLRNISLTVSVGERLVIMGANAGGKTTLLKLMAGLLIPQVGNVMVGGKAFPEARDRVGILFQNPDHQMLASTVAEEIACGLELRAVPPQVMEPQVEAALARFSLSELRMRAPETLSGGQKQRVALAAIMVLRPDFLLLDEPDSYLDAPSRRELQDAIDRIGRECGIVWMLPHARRLPTADRYFLLQDGQLAERSRQELEQMTATAVPAARPCA